jgi:hypothetical protein
LIRVDDIYTSNSAVFLMNDALFSLYVYIYMYIYRIEKKYG